MFGKLKEKLSGGASKISGKTDLLEGIAAMAALVSAADGEVEDSEVGSILASLQNHSTLSAAFSGPEIERAVDKQLSRVKQGAAGRLSLNREIAEMVGKNPTDELEMAFVIAIDVASADGEIEPKEKEVLEKFGKSLGFSLSSYA